MSTVPACYQDRSVCEECRRREETKPLLSVRYSHKLSRPRVEHLDGFLGTTRDNNRAIKERDCRELEARKTHRGRGLEVSRGRVEGLGTVQNGRVAAIGRASHDENRSPAQQCPCVFATRREKGAGRNELARAGIIDLGARHDLFFRRGSSGDENASVWQADDAKGDARYAHASSGCECTSDWVIEFGAGRGCCSHSGGIAPENENSAVVQAARQRDQNGVR